MIYLFVISLLMCFALFCATVFTVFKYKKLLRKLKEKDRYLKTVINSVNTVRWGNLYERVEAGFDNKSKELSEGLNELFESISDREKMIREYIEKEKELNIMKTDFVATLTHDLKVPIIAQDKTFELFLNKKFGDITKVQEDVIKKLKISNMDLKHLVDALLETYKMEQTKPEIKRSKNVDISAFIKDIICELDSILVCHNKKINFIDDGDNLKADIDVGLIKRVIQNLILNALNHSVRSDVVDIILKKNDEKSFKIMVRDYGIGIDKGEIDKIFKKYYSNSTKFSRSGVGLGLYLSNKIISLHKGKIEVETKENEGSTFSVILNYK